MKVRVADDDPISRRLLRARVRGGARVAALTELPADRVRDREQALGRATPLQGLSPTCADGQRIRKGQNSRQQAETHMAHHSDARFSQGLRRACHR